MNILFVRRYTNEVGGGTQISNRNLSVLKSIYGNENVDIYDVKGTTRRVFTLYHRCIKHYINGLSSTDVKAISQDTNNYDFIWIDNSCFGAICKILKDNGYKGLIAIFFHNIEYRFIQRPLLQCLLSFFFHRPIKLAEKKGASYADITFVLTHRDKCEVNKLSQKANIIIIPSSLPDTYIGNCIFLRDNTNYKTLNLLFVGSYFFANVNGITWFINEVLPYVNARLTVVGSNMNKLPFKNSDKLEILGFVDDIGTYYQKADCVIAPIFEGSGMKTKTTEALMWGKYIIGTEEAFCGFEINDEVGISCHNSDSFIHAIEQFRLCHDGKSKFNVDSRNLYLEKYSLSSSERVVKDAMNKIS